MKCQCVFQRSCLGYLRLSSTSRRPSPFRRPPLGISLRSTEKRQIARTQAESSLDMLNDLWIWGYNNGIPGIGTEDCKICIFEADEDYRGFYAVTDIKEGEEILRVPIRIGFMDYSDDIGTEGSEEYEAPWAVRLACRILREKAEGESSPWYPFIMSLPTTPVGIIHSLSLEDIEAIEYDEIKSHLVYCQEVVDEAWRNLDPAAHGNSTREELIWAVTIVHSRSFGGQVQQPGDDRVREARVLLPVADMFNHGGNRCNGLFRNEVLRLNSVDWDFVPSLTAEGEWDVRFTATTDVSADQEVLISYGDKNNDGFFAFYGFIPPLNSDDDYVIFQNLEEAGNWYADRFLPEIDGSKRQTLLEQVKNIDARDPDLRQGDNDSLKQVYEDKIEIISGSFVDDRLSKAFQLLRKESGIEPSVAVAERCWEILSTQADLLDDLQILKDHPSYVHNFDFLHQFYSQSREKFLERGGRSPTSPKDTKATPKSLSHAEVLTKTFVVYKKMILWDILLGQVRS